MARRSISLLLSTVVLLLMVVGGTTSTVGYIQQTQISISISGPNVVKCNRSAAISARVVSNKNGKPVRNQLVTWSLSAGRSGADGLGARSTVTNRNGRTGTTLSFGPVAGPRTVTATATRSSAKITIRCAGGLPPTSIRVPHDDDDAPSAALLPPTTSAELASEGLPAQGIRVDRLGIDLPIAEGDGVSVPEGAASHYPGTAWPGEGSNTYIYAHAREGNFLELWRVRTGDTVAIDMADGSVFEYRVSEILPLVEWDALDFLQPTSSERVTLQTSVWYDDTSPRFVVIAERVPSA